MNNLKSRIAIIGGCGHVGLPLGLALASRNMRVDLVDINSAVVEKINNKVLPFKEEGADNLLTTHVGENLFATTNPEVVREADVVIFVTGTPVDEHHNPRVQDVIKVIDSYQKFLNSDQLIVLRSTVFPGVIELVYNQLCKTLTNPKVSFCPERIVQGKGIEEIFTLPQIVSGWTEEAESEAAELFGNLTPKIIYLKPKEAELAKLVTNAWRYLEFAIANQFYMMVESQGFDFYKIYSALKEDYPRAAHYAKPGFAAGPCLFKDTMQLSAFHKNNFFLGQSAMLVNEGLPSFVVDQLEDKLGSLNGKRIALLGMTFKANNDDTRESLSFKVKKLLQFRMAEVLVVDPYLKETMSPGEAIERADGVILGVPHNEFRDLRISKPFIDCWGYWRNL